ncbi:MAG: DUF481 domain-containing protein [Vicinamibacteria bacterium]|jgi:hypothetical protein|nr:DUF481 domain-containing protein [Vicinamibacteria bacterium]
MIRKTAVLAAACTLALAGTSAQAQENKAPGWYAKVVGNFAMTNGNSEASTLGFSADVTRAFLRSDVNLVAGALRQSNTKFTFGATGTSAAGPFTIRQDETTEVSSEAYFVRLKGRYRFTERLAGVLGGDYERDVPAGIDSRTIGVAGVDYLFAERDNLKFSVGAGVTVTSETQVVPEGQGANVALAGPAESGLGARFGWKLEYGFGNKDDGGKPGSRFLSDLVVDQDLENTDDLRVNAVHAIEVAINRTFGLRVGMTLKYDNDPPVLALKPVNPTTGQAVNMGTSPLPTIALEKTDMIFTAGLTVNVFSAR